MADSGIELVHLAGAKHDEAMAVWYGKPGGYAGRVTVEDEGITWSIFHGDDGSLGIIEDTSMFSRRLEWGPPGRWYARKSARPGSDGPFKGESPEDVAKWVAEFTAKLQGLTFSAGEKGVALRCCLCEKAPIEGSKSIDGHYALCDEHWSDWLSKKSYDEGTHAGQHHMPMQQHILYRLGLLDAAIYGPHAGDWEDILMDAGYSARCKVFPGQPEKANQ